MNSHDQPTAECVWVRSLPDSIQSVEVGVVDGDCRVVPQMEAPLQRPKKVVDIFAGLIVGGSAQPDPLVKKSYCGGHPASQETIGRAAAIEQRRRFAIAGVDRGPRSDALVVGTAKYCEQTPELGMRRKPAGDLLQRVFRIPAIIIRETDNVAARQAQSRISVPARLRVSNAGAEFSAAHAGAARDLIGRRGSGQP